MANLFDVKAFEEDVIEGIITYGSLSHSLEVHSEEVLQQADNLVCDGVLSHADADEIASFIATYPRIEKEQPGVDYGVTNVENLYPEETELNKVPKAIREKDTGYIGTILNGMHKVPYSRIKMTWADLTAEEARARGYIKGNYKKNQIMSFLRRTTKPATIYYKQTIDRDDLIDVTGFDLLQWMHGEMDWKLDREKAIAIFVGDGRGLDSNDEMDPYKIDEDAIRPIIYEPDLFCIKKRLIGLNTTANSPMNVNAAWNDKKCSALINTLIMSRSEYEGSGNPIFFTTEEVINEFYLMRDAHGHFMYNSEEEIKAALNVSRIVTVPALEYTNFNTASSTAAAKNGIVKNEEDIECGIIGILVNPSDIYCCSDKGGARAWFSKFDIDYNKKKVLVEERFGCSLVKPYSCLVILNAVEDSDNYPEQSTFGSAHYVRTDKTYTGEDRDLDEFRYNSAFAIDAALKGTDADTLTKYNNKYTTPAPQNNDPEGQGGNGDED